MSEPYFLYLDEGRETCFSCANTLEEAREDARVQGCWSWCYQGDDLVFFYNGEEFSDEPN